MKVEAKKLLDNESRAMILAITAGMIIPAIITRNANCNYNVNHIVQPEDEVSEALKYGDLIIERIEARYAKD